MRPFFLLLINDASAVSRNILFFSVSLTQPQKISVYSTEIKALNEMASKGRESFIWCPPSFRFFNENEGSTSLIFLTKAWKKERKEGGDWWVQQKVKRWKREGGERSGRPAHINAALWASGPVIKFHTIWGSKWHVNYKWPILCFSVTVLNKRGVREIIRLYCAKRGREGGLFKKKKRVEKGEKKRALGQPWREALHLETGSNSGTHNAQPAPTLCLCTWV